MKKFFVTLLGVLMAVGLGTAAMAAPTLSFDIDFYGDHTSYDKGVFDTGSTIDLIVGQSVNVDILFSVTEEGIVAGGFTIPINSATLSASDLSFPTPFINAGYSGIDADKIDYEAMAWPGGTVVGPGSDYLFASFVLTCSGLGLDELWLNDLDSRIQWVTSPSGFDLDDQLGVKLASVNNNVPIPGALWLLGSGLIGLFGIRRRMKK